MDSQSESSEHEVSDTDMVVQSVKVEPQTENFHWGEAPRVNMVFQSVEKAYDFYNAYGRSLGFSVRIKTTNFSRKSRKVLKRVLCCSKQGARREYPSWMPKPKHPRPHTRTGCMACMDIRLQVDGNYVVVQFIAEHNHELAKQSEVHMLRSQRKIQNSQPAVIDSTHSVGIESTSISEMHAEAGGSQNLNFTRSSCDNYVQRKPSKILKKGDAQVMLNYFKHIQAKNLSFFYAIQMDEDNQLSSCFWCDAKSRMDYSFFGDVICFDTTYKTNGYDMPYALFVGVNHHNQPVIFGSALLFDESTESFMWIFETFLESMNGKPPKTIFSDQAQAIANAIGVVLPNTHHRLCLRHIYQNAAMHLSQVFAKCTSFATCFKKCIYDDDTEEEFKSDWDTLRKKYNLVGNDWLESLYQVREKWALVYGREHFCAGMTTPQQSESMNSFLKKYFRKTPSLQELVTRYEDAVKDRRDQEIAEDYNSRQTKPILMSKWSLEEQAAKRYTRTIFEKKFQEQLKECLDLFAELVGEDGTMYTYKVTSYGGMGGRVVTFDSFGNTLKCSCKTFEFTGFLCSHALKVLHTRQLPEIPSQYLLHRWTKDATAGAVIDVGLKSVQVDCQPSLISRYSELAHIALTLAVKGSSSESSCTLAKKKLMQVLQEIDFSMQVDQDQSKRVHDIRRENVDEKSDAVQACIAITPQDPPRKKTKKSGSAREGK